MKTKEEMQAIREAQKRLSWIDNVKRIYGWDQERAEKIWASIFKPETRQDSTKITQPEAPFSNANPSD